MTSENEALEAITKAGVQIIRPDKTLFSEKIKDTFEKYKDDKSMSELIQSIQNTN